MEPLAPGTEDDPLYTQISRPSKKEILEDQALSKKGFLPNGKYDAIFELNYIQGAQHWFCRLCECPVLGKLFNHEIGKRHTANLEKWNRTTESGDKDGGSASGGDGNDVSIQVAPGEPVPPGFEGEVEKITMIQDRLDGFNAGPIVGLEYLLELMDYDPSKEPSYLCILCDKKGDPRTVLTHLSSYNHQIMYLQKHFPTAYRHIAPYMIKAFKRNWQTGIQKIAEAIESTFGRLKPMPVEAGKFDKDRMYYIEIVAKGKHFNELSGHTFEHVVTKDDLTKVHEEPKPYDSNLPFRKATQQTFPKRKSPSPPVVARPIKRQKPTPDGGKSKKRSLSPVSDISSSDLEDFDAKTGPKENRSPMNDVRRVVLQAKPPPTSKGRSDGWRRSPSPRRREGLMPWQKSNYVRTVVPPVQTASERRRDEKAEKTEEFKKLAKAIDTDMEQVLKKHKQNPEKHPKYNDEWKKFWNSRYKELQTQGKNAATHDFKPEWIEFWNKRMLELHQEEIKAKKMALRKRLGLPEEATPISFKIAERRKLAEPASNKPIPTAAQPDNDPEVIVIEDNDKESDRSHSPPSKNRGRSRSSPRKRERSPQFRRRSPVGRRDSPPSRRRVSPPIHRQSPPARRPSPPVRRPSPPARRPSPPARRPSPMARRPSPPARRPSPPIRRPSPPVHRSSPPARRPSPPVHKQGRRASPPPVRRRSVEKKNPGSKSSPRDMRFSPPMRRYSSERSPGQIDRFGAGRSGRSKDRSKSRGRSRESSWERDRHRDFDDKHSYRMYRSRGGHAPWDSPPLSRERLYAPMVDPYAPPKVMRDVTREPVLYESPSTDRNDDVNIVGVLRLLTALEEKLGSLGPKVIELLGQALAMEKKTANSSEELLESEINCVLFETVKEKLKGQMQAGLVDRIEENAYKIAIRKTANLIHVAGERKKQKEVEMPKKPVVVPGVGTVDKGKIARQIANALIAQGKTDVTQAELEQLINAVVGIAEAQKNSASPMTTASFLDQLTNPASISDNLEPSSKTKEQPTNNDKDDSASPNKEMEKNTRKIEEEQDASNSSIDKSTMNMEGLSDSDLQTLLQNFKDLSTEEQHGLINYLKKLEAKEPERVEKLRKFVNLTENKEEKSDTSGRYSPFSNRTGSVNPAPKENEAKPETKTETETKSSLFVNIDSEDEEYSFEDVAKAASLKVIEKEMERKRQEEETKRESDDKNLNDAKALITSLMSSLNKGTARPPAAGGSGDSSKATQPAAATTAPQAEASNEQEAKQTAGKINIISNVPVSTSDLAKSLSGITMSMSSLGSILGNVQNMTRQNQTPVSAAAPEPRPDHQDFPGGGNRPNPRNPYDEFDIGSQKDVRGNPSFAEQPKNRPTKTYDEFNIGPNPGEFRDETADPLSRSVGRGGPGYGPGQRGPSYPNKSIGYSDRNIPQNLQPQDRGKYVPSGGGFRGNNSNQYPSRGGYPSNNMRSNNFEIRGVPGDFGPDRGDFRGGLNESRGGMGDFRAGLNDMRGGPNDLRGGPLGGDARSGNMGDLRGRPHVDLRGDSRGGAHGDVRGGLHGDVRGGPHGDLRGGPHGDVRGGPHGDVRGGPHGDLRGGPHGDVRGGPHGDLRGGPHGDLRGVSHGDLRSDMRGDFRGEPGDFRSGSDYRASDFRMDSRDPTGNYRGGMDDMRSIPIDSRGGSGLSRGGPPSKGGMLIDPNRLGNPAPSRFSGNYGGNNSSMNSFNRW